MASSEALKRHAAKTDADAIINAMETWLQARQGRSDTLEAVKRAELREAIARVVSRLDSATHVERDY